MGVDFDHNWFFFDQIESNMSWLLRSKDPFGIWEHLLNPIWVTKALNRSQKSPNMVLKDKFYQPYSLSGTFLTQTSCYFYLYQKKDNVSWPPPSNDHLTMWKPLLNPIWVCEALNRPQNCPNMVLNGKFSQPYIQYPVRARASGGAVFSSVTNGAHCFVFAAFHLWGYIVYCCFWAGPTHQCDNKCSPDSHTVGLEGRLGHHLW